MSRKFKFLWSIYKYKVQGLLGLKRSDIMPVINDYYSEAFKMLKKDEIAVILPHCLIADKCPARFSKTDGIICTKCTLCGCGKIFSVATEKGYQFYITPSVGFTKRLIQRKKIKGIIGIACDYEIEKGLSTEKVTMKGLKISGNSIKTKGLRLHAYDCIKNSVDWDKVEEML